MAVAYFEKVSRDQYLSDCLAQYSTAADLSEDALRQKIDEEYDNIILPQRATRGSAGYDFYIPRNVSVGDLYGITVPTGIRVHLDPGWMLVVFPRSGLGFKYGLRLVNTVGIIDSDYYNADNEGHIMIRMIADSAVDLSAGDRFAQGILIPYGLASNDFILTKQRKGGFGSTGGIQ